MDHCAESNHGCEQLCRNTGDSYVCECSEGFVINEDLKTCTRKSCEHLLDLSSPGKSFWFCTGKRTQLQFILRVHFDNTLIKIWKQKQTGRGIKKLYLSRTTGNLGTAKLWRFVNLYMENSFSFVVKRCFFTLSYFPPGHTWRLSSRIMVLWLLKSLCAMKLSPFE